MALNERQLLSRKEPGNVCAVRARVCIEGRALLRVLFRSRVYMRGPGFVRRTPSYPDTYLPCLHKHTPQKSSLSGPGRDAGTSDQE